MIPVSTSEWLWLIAGLVGQVLFFLRFLVQWWRSEQAGRSVLPVQFWYFSIAGGLVLLIYALHRQDPVFALGQGGGIAIYLRNLVLMRRAGQGHSDG